MTKRYLVEFVSIVQEKYTAEVDVPDHIADDDLREYLQDIVSSQPGELMPMDLHAQDVLSSILTTHEEVS